MIEDVRHQNNDECLRILAHMSLVHCFANVIQDYIHMRCKIRVLGETFLATCCVALNAKIVEELKGALEPERILRIVAKRTAAKVEKRPVLCTFSVSSSVSQLLTHVLLCSSATNSPCPKMKVASLL